MTTPHTSVGKLPQGRAGEGWLAAWATAWNTFWFTPADPLRLVACAEVVLIVVLLQLRWYRSARWDDVQRQIRRVREG